MADADGKLRNKDLQWEVSTFLPAEMSDREQRFHHAASSNDVDAVRGLLHEGVRIDCRNSLDRTALHCAAASGHLDVTRALIEGGAALEITDKFGMTAALWSAWFGHVDVLKQLVESGADKSASSKQGMGLVHCAAANGHMDIITCISNSMTAAFVDATEKSKERTALHLAAEAGHQKAVDTLLQLGAHVHLKDKTGSTAVHLAAQKGHSDVIRRLLLVGVEIDDVNDEGNTAVHLASEHGHLETMNVLLEYNADPNCRTTRDCTPLHLAAAEGHADICTTLVLAGSDINVKNSAGNTALHLAATGNHREVAEVLVENEKTERDLQNHRLQTALHVAVEADHLEVVQVMLEGGADLHLREKTGKSPLQLAARGNHVAIVDMLIRAERFYDMGAMNSHPNGNGGVWYTTTTTTQEQPSDIDQTSQANDYDGVDKPTTSAQPPPPDIDRVGMMTTMDLRRTLHPAAGALKEVLWRLATRQLKPGEWKMLAAHWGFLPEHLRAIEHAYTGSHSYRDHGYRLLSVWLHGVPRADNPIKLLFEALVAIGRKQLAEQIRRQANRAAAGKPVSSSKKCTLS